jgi:hypothetical protein
LFFTQVGFGTIEPVDPYWRPTRIAVTRSGSSGISLAILLEDHCYQYRFLSLNLPIAHEFLRGLPASEIQRLPHLDAVQFPLDGEREIEMAVLTPFTTNLQLLKCRLKIVSMPRVLHAVHTHVSRSLQIADLIRVRLVPGGGVEPPRPCDRRILSPLRLPVPPSRLGVD